jgi:hypothetical protein
MRIHRLAVAAILAAAFTPGLARAEYELLDSFYVNGGVAAIQLQNSDLNTYYGTNSFGPSIAEAYDIAFGWQFRQPFAIEFGGTFGPFRSSSSTYLMPNSNVPFQNDTITDSRDESTYSFYVMPALRLISPGLGSMPMLHTLGVKLGGASMVGTENFTDQTTGDTRSQTNSATGDYFAVVYRAEQMLGRSLSLGLEFGYASNVFNEVDFSDGTFYQGSGAPASSNEPLDFGWNGVNTNADGSNEHADFSGPFVKVMLGGWFLPAFRRLRTGQFDTSDPDTQVIPHRPGDLRPAPSQAALASGSFSSPDGSRLVKVLDGGDAFLYDTATPPAFSPVFLAHNVTRVRFSSPDQGQDLQVQLSLADGSTLHFDATGQPIRFR